MNHLWAKNRATSRRAGSRRDVTESKQAHVATCGFTSRRDRAPDQTTSRRDRELYSLTSRRENTRRDVAEG